MPLYKLIGLDKYIPKIQLSYTGFFFVYLLCLVPALAVALISLLGRRNEFWQPKGCRKLGLRIKSNLADEHDKKYSQRSMESEAVTDGSTWTVKSLLIFPVKSCQPVELNRHSVIATGMQYDRQFSFAQLKGTEDEVQKWEFVTQRTLPLLAKVRTEIWVPDESSPTYSPKQPDVRSSGVIVMSFPCREKGWKGIVQWMISRLRGGEPEKSFRVPYNPTPDQISKKGYAKEQMTIWKDSPQALNMVGSFPQELATFLGARKPLTLFRVDQDHWREVFRCAPRKGELGYQPITGFADAYPLHIINLASVHDVQREVYEDAREKGVPPKEIPKIGALRFRPNMVITGPKAYEEDSWKRIRIGGYEYHVACRTARCKLPNVDPTTGVKHAREPDQTLRRFRCIDEGAGNNACLGMQMVPALEKAEIRVGDVVEVLETGEHFYLKQ
ncbi:hypothetical protein MMC20_001820 [Loxospora ochrophaea]|nr:hypothetical protein [Loxospora ochrophaea]